MPIPTNLSQSFFERVFLSVTCRSKSLRFGIFLLQLSYLFRRASEPLLTFNGQHLKHSYNQYPDWFISFIGKNDNVLDVGSSTGFLSSRLASSCKHVTAVEISTSTYNISLYRNKHILNLSIFNDDIFSFLLGQNLSFDFTVLSNVLEHIKDRPYLLNLIRKSSKNLLIRVPDYNRDWANSLLNEKRKVWVSDYTHCIEHTYEELCFELSSSGFTVVQSHFCFGEIYVFCN